MVNNDKLAPKKFRQNEDSIFVVISSLINFGTNFWSPTNSSATSTIFVLIFIATFVSPHETSQKGSFFQSDFLMNTMRVDLHEANFHFI